MSKRTTTTLGLLVAVGLSFSLAIYEVRAGGNPNPGVAPPQARAHGNSYGQWGALWTQWALSFPLALYPPGLPSGYFDASLGQSGSVWFLSGTGGGGHVERSCSIPPGKSLFFPIINYLNDYPCPDSSFQPAPGETLEHFLTSGAADVLQNVTDLEVVVDGKPLKDLFDYRGTSRLFTFRADPSLFVLDPCFTGTLQFGVVDGYWLLLNPLPPGPHTISIFGQEVFPDASSFAVDVTYHITVTH
jgi:hypothetical protein